MASNKHIVSELYSKTSKLDTPKERQIFLANVKKYFDKNSEKMFCIGPMYQVFFTDRDKSLVYDLMGVTPLEVKGVLKESDAIRSSWEVMNEPFNTAMTMVIRYFTINKLTKEMPQAILYFAMSFYPSLFHKYFPKGEPNDAIMEFTVNNLSNKFVLKQEGSLAKAILYTAVNSHAKYKDKLVRGQDEDIVLYISSLKIRLNNFMKNISDEFYQNHKSGRYLNHDSDSYEEDNFHIADNNSLAIQRTADTAAIYLTSNGPNMKLVEQSARLNKVSTTVFRNAIIKICDRNIKEIQEMFMLILQIYIFDNKNGPQDIRSQKFLFTALEIYKKSNTNDPAIVRLKILLDTWMKESSVEYTRTEREATMSSFRRALYTFLVLTIQQSA